MIRTRNRITSLVLVLVMLASYLVVPAAAQGSFSDVSDTAWYAGAVSYVEAEGWMKGVGNDRFAPEAPVTRAMFATILARFAQAETNDAETVFADVPTGTWYTGAITWAQSQGIVNGVGQGCFAPADSISRQDLCTMLARFLRTQGYSLEQKQSRSFKDASDVSTYAAEAVELCASVGLVAGFEDSTFRPRATTNRAQVATILMRLDLLLDGQEAPSDPMPAQSFVGGEEEGISVAVLAPQGTLPAGTKMKVRPVTDEAVLATIQGKVQGNVLGAVDITFLYGNDEIEPAGNVDVQIAMDGLDRSMNPSVVHVTDEYEVERVPGVRLVTKEELNTVQFSSKDFSIYAVVDSGNDARLEVVFHLPTMNADGTYSFDDDHIQSIYVSRVDVVNKDGENETAYNYLPTIIPDFAIEHPSEKSPRFFGWFIPTEDHPDYTKDDADGKHDINAVRAKVKETLEYYDGTTDEKTLRDCDRDQAIDVYPILFHFYTVSYVDELGDATLDTLPVYSKTMTASVPIFSNYDPQTVGYTFNCWVNVETGEDVQNGTTIDIDKSIVLRATLKEGCYIIFDENPGSLDRYHGATYVAPIWCPNGVVPQDQLPNAADMKLQGYSFGGWYLKNRYTENTAENGVDSWAGTEYSFPTQYSKVDNAYQNVELVAKWNRASTSFIVLIELQSTSDDPGLANSAKHYSTYKTMPGTANTGETVNVATKYPDYINPSKMIDANVGSYKFFEYNAANSTLTQVVQSDGSTVFRIRFDRKTITYQCYAKFTNSFTSGTFSNSDLPYTDATNSYYYYNPKFQHYGYNQATGEYFPLNLEPRAGASANSNGDIYVTNCKWTNAITGETYTATHSRYSYNSSYYYPDTNIYIANATQSSKGDLQFACSGLYGAPVKDGKWEHYCTADYEQWYHLETSSSGTSEEIMSTGYTTYTVPDNATSTTLVCWLSYYVPNSDTRSLSVYYMGLDGAYNDEPRTDDIPYRMWYSYRHRPTGFELVKIVAYGGTYQGSRLGFDGTDVAWLGYFTDSSYSKPSQGDYLIPSGGAEIYYKRNQHALTFYVDNVEQTDKAQPKVYYNAKLSDYVFTPETNDNQYFVQWYTDENCTIPIDVSTAKMPDRPLTLYTKLETTKYRVFLHTGIDEDEFIAPENNYEWPELTTGEEAVDWEGDQKKNFSVPFGQAISNGQTIMGTRKDAEGNTYMLLGWFTDPNYENPFLFGSTVLNDSTTYSYSKTEITDGPNEAHPDGYNADANRPWVKGKLDLYAKWRKLLKGATGVDVVYNSVGPVKDSDPVETNNGYFDKVGTDTITTYYDTLHYADGSQSIAEAGSTPENDEAYQFLYWEIMKPTSSTDETLIPAGLDPVYPGTDFTVDAALAIAKKVTGGDHTHRYVLVKAVAPNCVDYGHNQYYWCPSCGNHFAHEGDTATITPEIYPNSNELHAFEDYESAGASGHYKVCKFCGAHETEDVLPHNYEDTVVEPTSNTPGYTEHVCSDCGYSYKDNYTEPTGVIYTVTFKVPEGLTAPAPVQVRQGNSIVLPGFSDYMGYTFLGWVSRTIENEDAMPNDVLPSSYTPPQDVTLHALYLKHTTTGTGKYYALLKTNPPDWNGNYVITYGTNSSLKALLAPSSSTSIESSDYAKSLDASGITLDGELLRSVPDTYVFTVANPEGETAFTLYNAANGVYVGQNASGYMYAYTDAASNALWNLSYADGVVTVQNKNSTGYPYFAYRSYSSMFYAYSSATANLSFWREFEEGYDIFTTVISGGGENPDPTEQYTVTYTVPSGLTAPAAQTVNANASVNLPTADAPAGYTFLGWVTDDYDNVDTKPGNILTGSYGVTGNVTLKALYTRNNGTAYVPAALADITAGNYLIAMASDAGNYKFADGGISTGGDMTVTTDTAAVSNGSIAESALPDSASVFTFTGNASEGFAISKADGTYLGYSNYTVSRRLAFDNSYSSILWTPILKSNDDQYGLCLSCVNEIYTISQNGTNIRGYASDTKYSPLYLFKETQSDVTYTTIIRAAHVHSYAWDGNIGSNGQHTLVCANTDGQCTELTKTEACAFTDEVTQPTETQPGYTTHTCNICGYSYQDSTTYRVTFSVPSGVTMTEQYRTSSASTGLVNLPTGSNLSNIPEGYTFVGWIEDSTYEGTTAPENLATGTYEPEACCTLYAVFSITTEGGSGTSTVSDTLTVSDTGIDTSKTNYQEWSGVTLSSDAVYGGCSARGAATNNLSIQLKSKDSESGIVSTASGGKITKVTLAWNSSTASGRKVIVYGKNTAYTSPTNLYNNSNQGTQLGTITCGTSTELTVSGDYEYVGIRSSSGALYLDNVTFTWSTESSSGNTTTWTTNPGDGNGAGAVTEPVEIQEIAEIVETESIEQPAAIEAAEETQEPELVTEPSRNVPTLRTAAGDPVYRLVTEVQEGKDYILVFFEDGVTKVMCKHLNSTIFDRTPKLETVTTEELGNGLYRLSATTSEGVALTTNLLRASRNGSYWRFLQLDLDKYLGMQNYVLYKTLDYTDADFDWSYNNGVFKNELTTKGKPYLVTEDDHVLPSATDGGAKLLELATYTVTFKNGSDDGGNTIYTQTVNYGGSAADPTTLSITPTSSRANYVFDHWNGTYTNVTSDVVVEAVYRYVAPEDPDPGEEPGDDPTEPTTYTVTFKDLDGNVLGTQTVTSGGLRFVPALTSGIPTISGQTFIGWATLSGEVVDVYSYPITRDTTFITRYQKDVDERFEYTLHLRAVYGPMVGLKKTHISFYSNNGSGEMKNSVDVQINESIDIFKPGDDGFFRFPGHRFLGWAKLPETEKGSYGTLNGWLYGPTAQQGEEEVNLAKYLWLEYHEPETEGAAGTFTVNEPNNTEVDNKQVTSVAANERDPIEGLYAVWAPEVFYVVHSSDGTVEAVSMPVKYTRIPGGLDYNGNRIDTWKVEETSFDLTSLVQDGYRYGGYYSVYGGVKKNTATDELYDIQALAQSYVENKSGWNLKNPKGVYIANVGAEASKSLTDNLAPYGNADLLKYEVETGNEVRFFDKGNAYGYGSQSNDLIGSELRPVAGQVYYLKEVPEAYLKTKAYMVKKGNEITSLFLVSVIDDITYRARYINDETCRLATSLSIQEQYDVDLGDSSKIVITPESFEGVNRGYLLVQQVDLSTLPAGATSIDGGAKWITYDGVNVEVNPETFDFPAGATVSTAAAGLLQPQVVQNRQTVRGASAEETEDVGELIFTVDGSVTEITE